MLVSYGSASPEPEPVVAAVAAVARGPVPPPPAFAQDSDDSADEECNLTNSFAIPEKAPVQVARAVTSTAVVKSAPHVVLDVSSSAQALHSSLVSTRRCSYACPPFLISM